jgi:two-component system, LytTR family, sensor kinase
MAVLAGGVARAYSMRYRARQEHAVRLEAERAALQAQLAGARLEALRMQLDPHFLFNTLHAISSLVERDPKGVRRMISRLSELLRHSIEGSAEQETPLRDELDLLRRYIDIMEIRFQGQLEVRTDMDEDTLDALVPNLILQPLVENAIKHGVSKVEGTGRITLSARREGGELVLRVWNNGPPPETDVGSSDRGIGVRNTMERLSRLYGSEQRFALQPDSDGGTLVEIRLPYHRRDEIRVAAAPISAAG